MQLFQPQPGQIDLRSALKGRDSSAQAEDAVAGLGCLRPTAKRPERSRFPIRVQLQGGFLNRGIFGFGIFALAVILKVLREHHMKAWYVLMLVGSGLAAWGKLSPEEQQKLPTPAAHAVDFERDIKPLLEESCIKCHGRGKDKAGFAIDNSRLEAEKKSFEQLLDEFAKTWKGVIEEHAVRRSSG